MAITVVGALARIAWAAYAARPLAFPVGGDPLGYAWRAREMARGGGYTLVMGTRATAFQPPGWPLLLAAWYWIGFHTPLPNDIWNLAAMLDVALSTASIVLLYAIGRRAFGATVGLVAAALLALWPNVVFYTAVPALETSFVFFALLATWLLLRTGWPARPDVSWRSLAVVGVVTGCTLLIRPFAATMVVAVALAGGLAGRGWRRAAVDAGIVLASAVVVLVPWTIRNAVQLHGFVPVATNLGETLCIGHQPDATGALVGDTEYCVGRWSADRIVRPHDEIERNRHATRQAVKYAFGHPVDEARLLFRRGYYMLRSDHDALDAAQNGTDFVPHRLDAVLRGVADGYFFAVGTLALFAIGAFVRRGADGERGARLFVFLTGLGLLLVPLELYGLPRFKVPLAPFVALGAAATLAHASRATSRAPDRASVVS